MDYTLTPGSSVSNDIRTRAIDKREIKSRFRGNFSLNFHHFSAFAPVKCIPGTDFRIADKDVEPLSREHVLAITTRNRSLKRFAALQYDDSVAILGSPERYFPPKFLDRYSADFKLRLVIRIIGRSSGLSDLRTDDSGRQYITIDNKLQIAADLIIFFPGHLERHDHCATGLGYERWRHVQNVGNVSEREREISRKYGKMQEQKQE